MALEPLFLRLDRIAGGRHAGVAISEADRTKIGRTNARALFKLDTPKR